MSVFVDVVNAIVDLTQTVKQFFGVDLYQFAVDTFAEYVKYSMLATIKFKIYMIGFSYDVAQSIINSLNFSAILNQYYSALDSNLLSVLNFMRVPDCINLLVSAYTTRMVMRFIGVTF